MRSLSQSAAKLRYLFTAGRPDQDFDEELDAHLHMLADRFVSQGMAPGEAWSAARRQFGNPTSLKETRTQMQTFRWLETLIRDVRFGLRSLRRNPAFALCRARDFVIGNCRQLHHLFDGQPVRPVHRPCGHSGHIDGTAHDARRRVL